MRVTTWPALLHQVFEQAELARLQLDRLAGARDRVRQPVEHEIADDVARLRCSSGCARRASASTRASSSEKANGLVR